MKKAILVLLLGTSAIGAQPASPAQFSWRQLHHPLGAFYPVFQVRIPGPGGVPSGGGGVTIALINHVPGNASGSGATISIGATNCSGANFYGVWVSSSTADT